VGERKDLADLLSGASLDQPVVLLDHNPLGLAEARTQPVDLMLSGHTHNGRSGPAA
jgi:predicted MPP superfamily phosphohydrolase